MYFQSTIKSPVELKGIGIHSGVQARILLLPAPINTGIVFLPSEKPGIDGIIAHIDYLLLTNNAITIGNRSFSITTIEHFMAAFYALDITNLYVVVDENELPILDGSSLEIVNEIEKIGIEMQGALSEIFYIPYPIWIEEGGSYLIALPNDSFKITYTIDFTLKSKAVGTQTAHFLIDRETFKRSIAPARTFGFLEDLEEMKTNNLALGGSLENALVFTKDSLMNDNLRFTNECVRHKILDLVGDLSLIGYKVRGHFIAYKSGHSMDMELVTKIDNIIKRKKSLQEITEARRKEEKEFEDFRRKINI